MLLQINTLRCQQKYWNTKGGQRQVHGVCIVRTEVGKKGTSQDKAMLNSKEIKPVALSIVELYLAGGISYLVSQSVSQCKILLNRKPLKFHRHFLERCGVGL